MPMARTQIYLTDQQRSRILDIAEASDSTMAEVIREAIELYLAQRDVYDDALLTIIGIGQSDDGHGSVDHDVVIYDAAH